ncbi:hypothetical protein CPJCM30710_01260 [Clostridium polyendosporum]|uniref:H+-ATPase subunit E/Vma4 n=1 Tax=Clostridium polyendosporum TaxID=69208 RepID=A0A919RXW1_9CLOT|nr:V-type ATP synthase subunit E [Clostridium polyendosporum]GIM27460.1 hypothetical protein CPJCM30710_01260 [Clostridium polyendosporum]
MTTIDDKLSLFSKIIYEKLDAEIENSILEFEKKKNEKLNVQYKKIAVLREEVLKDIEKKGRFKRNEIVSNEKLKFKKENMLLRKQLIKEVVIEVYKKIDQFTKSPQYKDYLLKSIEEILDKVKQGSYELMLTKQDIEKYKDEIIDILKRFHDVRVKLSYSNEDMLGGMLLIDEDKSFVLDNTLNSKIHDNKELIGKRVMELFTQEVNEWKEV